MTLTIHEIQARAYATACAKGWHDRPLRETREHDNANTDCPWNDPETFAHPMTAGLPCRCVARSIVHHDRVLRSHALMHTEITEAADAFDDGQLSMRIEDDKPEGFVVELADLAIRICDTTAALGVDLRLTDTWLARKTSPAATEIYNAVQPHECRERTRHWLDRVRRSIDGATEAARVDDWGRYADALAIALLCAAGICAGHRVDLGAAIKAKMQYNETRPHRHGGKQA